MQKNGFIINANAKMYKVLVSSNPTHRDGSFEHQKHV